MKNTIILLICYWGVTLLPTYAQVNDTLLRPKDLLFQFSHNTLFFSSFLNKGKVHKEYGKADLVNKLGFGFTGGWLHTLQLNQKFGLEMGFTVGVLPMNYYFNLKEKDFNVQGDVLGYGTEYFEFLMIPLNFVTRKELKKDFFIIAKIGANLRYIIIEETILRYSLETNEVVFNNYSTFDNHFRVNYNASLGLAYLLKNHDFISLNLVGYISFRNFINSEYFFFPNEPSNPGRTYGTYNSKGNYLGLSLGYTFTKVRKSLKRAKR